MKQQKTEKTSAENKIKESDRDNTTKNSSGFFKDRVYPVIFMVVITIIFITPISALYFSTADLVRENQALVSKKAVIRAAGLEIPPSGAEADDLYRRQFIPLKIQDPDGGRVIAFYRYLSSAKQPLGWIVIVNGPGLWGEIITAVGFDNDLTRIEGLEFISQNETPGLGARIGEDWFKRQFRRLRVPVAMAAPGEKQGSDQFEAITGATRTSSAVLAIVRAAETQIKELVKKVGP